MHDSKDGQGAMKRTTLVEEGTKFKGTFSSDCPIIVKGRIEGDVTGPSLTVSATGAVAGVVKVDLIESEGELSGEFEAEVVRLSGRVRDNTIIRAKSLEVKLAPEKGMMQVVFGECALEVGDMPSKEALVGASTQTTPASASPPVGAPAPQDAPEMTDRPLAPAATPEVPAPSVVAADVVVPSAAEADKLERKNGMRSKSGRPRNSEMPPPPA